MSVGIAELSGDFDDGAGVLPWGGGDNDGVADVQVGRACAPIGESEMLNIEPNH